MKIIYCTHSTCNPGGMERVLLNKVTYLSQLPGWKVAVVTTDQHQRPPFYQGTHDRFGNQLLGG